MPFFEHFLQHISCNRTYPLDCVSCNVHYGISRKIGRAHVDKIALGSNLMSHRMNHGNNRCRETSAMRYLIRRNLSHTACASHRITKEKSLGIIGILHGTPIAFDTFGTIASHKGYLRRHGMVITWNTPWKSPSTFHGIIVFISYQWREALEPRINLPTDTGAEAPRSSVMAVQGRWIRVKDNVLLIFTRI